MIGLLHIFSAFALGLQAAQAAHVGDGILRGGSGSTNLRRDRLDEDPVTKGPLMDKAEKSVQRVSRKVSRAPQDIPAQFAHDYQMIRDTFTPGFELKPASVMVNCIGISLASAWFAIYFGKMLRNDRAESRDDVKDLLKEKESKMLFGFLDSNRFCQYDQVERADLVIVFHHPDHKKHKEKGEKEIKRKDFKSMMVLNSSNGQQFHLGRSENLLRGFEFQYSLLQQREKPFEDALRQRFEVVGHDMSCTNSACHTIEIRTADEELISMEDACKISEKDEELFPLSVKCHIVAKDDVHITMQDARVALLQDIYGDLAKMGFDSEIFASVDGDELFVCISLERREWVRHYLTLQGRELQIQHKIFDKLGMGSAADEAADSAPYLEFSPELAKHLAQRGLIDTRDKPEEQVEELYVTHQGRNEEMEIIGGADRFRIIYQQINANVNLDRAAKLGLVVNWFPVHRLTSLQKIGLLWASPIWDMTFVQPVHLIRDYFGTRIAYIVAWNGLYAKALMGLTPFAILWEVISFTAKYGLHLQGATRQILAFSLVIIMWSRIVFNLWDREQCFFASHWNLNGGKNQSLIRPEFDGPWKPSLADSKVREMQYPNGTAAIRFFSFCVTMLAVMLVTVVILVWVSIFDGNMDITASICLTIQIKVFEFFFKILSRVLTDMENHRFQEEHYNSFVLKQTVFAFVNSYWAFFFLAVKQRFTESGCPAGGCLAVMRYQLTLTMIILSVVRVVQVVVQCVMVRGALWWEDRGLKQLLDFQYTLAEHKSVPIAKELEQRRHTTGIEPQEWEAALTIESAGSPRVRLNVAAQEDEVDESIFPLHVKVTADLPKRTFVEEQGKYAPFRNESQIDAMLQSVIPLGYVILFGGVAPRIIPFAMIVFAVQLRATAFLLVTQSQRMVPRLADGIGSWRTVIVALKYAGVAFNGFLFTVYGDMLKNDAIITKISIVFCFFLSVGVLWALVDIAVPADCKTALVMDARRQRAHDKIRLEAVAAEREAKERSLPKHLLHQKTTLRAEGAGDDDALVFDGAWDKIEPAVRQMKLASVQEEA